MIYKVLVRVVVFVGCLVSINGETLKRAYEKKQLNEFTSGEAYLGPETETEVSQASSEIDCAIRCTHAADCNSFNYNSNNGSCHLNAGVVRKNISRLTEVANYRYYEYYEEGEQLHYINKGSIYIYIYI